MTEHLPELLQSLGSLEDASLHIITFMNDGTERAVWDTGTSMLSLTWVGMAWSIDTDESVRSWSRAARQAFDAACDVLQGPSRRTYLQAEQGMAHCA